MSSSISCSLPCFWPSCRGGRWKEYTSSGGTSVKNCLLSILAGVSLWLTASYVTQITRLFLDKAFGGSILDEAVQSLESTPYQIYLFLCGTVILAPICEEIFFRGFVQAAYERYSPRYGYIITGILFGSYHALNGISDVVPRLSWAWPWVI